MLGKLTWRVVLQKLVEDMKSSLVGQVLCIEPSPAVMLGDSRYILA